MPITSDIFDLYAELALEKGLISKASAKEKLENNPRADSLDISAIELLYGIKPETPKGMEYDNNIAEVAHKNPAVVSPAHDKLNGLVENINERNSILVKIVNKTPTGNLTGHKYASNELTMALVRIANDMDNKNIDELRVLADACINQINKKAVGPLPIIGVAVAALGAIYFQQHYSMANIGLEENGKRLIDELNDFRGDHLIGTDYTESFQATVKKLIEKINKIIGHYQTMKNSLYSHDEPKDMAELQKYMSYEPDLSKNFEKFNTIIANANPLFDMVQQKFEDKNYKLQQMKNVGFAEKANRLFGGIFSGGDASLVADDFKDVLRALVPFRESIKATLETLSSANKVAADKYKTLQAQYQKDMAAKPQENPSQPQEPQESKDVLVKGDPALEAKMDAI